MGKEYVTHSCGHEVVHQLYGPHASRDRKAAYLATQACPDCQKAARDLANAAKNAEAAEQANAAGLPELTGSEKQIAWATTIRQEKLGQIEQINDYGLSLLTGQTAASWWIDLRNEDFSSVYFLSHLLTGLAK